MDTIGKGAGTDISKAHELLYPYALSLFIGIIEFITQNGGDIDFIDKQEISLLVFANLSVNDFSNDFAALTSARNYVNLSRPKRQIQKFCDKRKT